MVRNDFHIARKSILKQQRIMVQRSDEFGLAIGRVAVEEPKDIAGMWRVRPNLFSKARLVAIILEEPSVIVL